MSKDKDLQRQKGTGIHGSQIKRICGQRTKLCSMVTMNMKIL